MTEKQYFTDIEIDKILVAVRQAVNNMISLAKSEEEQKEEEKEEKKEDKAENQDNISPADIEQLKEDLKDTQQPESTEKAEEEIENQAEDKEEAKEEDVESLSDEDLYNMYKGLDLEEIEKHFLIVKAVLMEKYIEEGYDLDDDEEDQKEQEDDKQLEKDEEEAKDEQEEQDKMEKEEQADDEKDKEVLEKEDDIDQLEQEEKDKVLSALDEAKDKIADALDEEEEKAKKLEQMTEKTEKFAKDLAALKKHNQYLETTLANTLKALELLMKPTRKSVASLSDLEVVKKSEQPDSKKLSKSEAIQILTDISKSYNLTKDEREAITKYTVGANNIDQIMRIIKKYQ